MYKEFKAKPIKVLVVTYDYYPDNSPNTYRWHNILKHWADLGCEIYVVSFQKSGFSKSDIINGIQIFRTGMSWVEILKSKIKNRLIYNETKSNLSQDIAKESLIKKIYNCTIKQIYFPDFAFLWTSSGVKLAAHLIKKHKIKNVITVSWPFTDHIIGYKLTKRFKINWIADTIDPFYLSEAVNNGFLYKKLNFKYENKVLTKANFITVLTYKLKDKYLELFPTLQDKLIVNHNVFIPSRIEIDYTKTKGDLIKLVFLGTLTPKTRSPIILLKLIEILDNFSDLNNFEFHIYGDTSQCNSIFEIFKHLINRRIFIHGLIEKTEVDKVFYDADILVNIGNTNEYQEPSKILEYIYYEKPIINICSLVNDSSKEVLKEYPINFNFYESNLNDKQKIQELISFIRHSSSLFLSPITKKTILKNYLLGEVQAKYFSLLRLNCETDDC